MRFRLGCEMTYEFPQPSPMIAMVNVHQSLAGFLEGPDPLLISPPVSVDGFRDGFGNWCCRLVAPAGRVTLGTDTVIRTDGGLTPADPSAIQHPVEDLPPDTLPFLRASRYCETDSLSDEAWRLFGGTPPGWARVQAINDFVHQSVTFGYAHSRPTRTAAETYVERRGVCRDFAHLAIALCRCMNVPARYCTGYLSDIDEPPPYTPNDFAAWTEVYLSGAWWTFDTRNDSPRKPRRGRALIARGRDAADVPLVHTFGRHTLTGFKVWADEIPNAKE
jgi:transglutaminase-like putative cysteine protease